MRKNRNARGGLIALVVLAVVAGTAGAVATRSDETTVTAVFANASPLVVGNSVKAHGVTVGQIKSIDLRAGQAHVTFELDGDLVPLHRDARAKIRPVSVLGERFVELDPGSAQAPPLGEREVIPIERTGSAVDLDQVLNTIDDPAGTALAALITTMGEGSRGQGPEIAAAIKALAPAMNQQDELLRLLNGQNAVLTKLIDQAEPVLTAMAGGRENRLDGLVGSTERTLSAVAADRAAFDAVLGELPRSLTQARTTLARLGGVTESTTPTLAGLRPLTGNLRDVGTELERMAEATEPALASLQPVLERAQRLVDEAAPLARALRPAGENLRGMTAGAGPVVAALHRNLGNLMDLVKYWALSTNGRDGLSHYFRAVAVVTPGALTRTVTGAVPGAGSATQPPDLPDLLPSLRKPTVGQAPGNVTGLTESQEKSLIDQLLGGS